MLSKVSNANFLALLESNRNRYKSRVNGIFILAMFWQVLSLAVSKWHWTYNGIATSNTSLMDDFETSIFDVLFSHKHFSRSV